MLKKNIHLTRTTIPLGSIILNTNSGASRNKRGCFLGSQRFLAHYMIDIKQNRLERLLDIMCIKRRSL
ncbi:hypothetical protein Hanom_Chr07g00673101 [Helianthus anomalus]